MITQPGALKNVYDVNPGAGGPIVKDKLWFFATARWTAAENYVPNNYPNVNFVAGQTNPTLLNRTTATYVPDTSQDLLTTLGGGGRFWEQTVRLSYQVTQKHKIGIYYNNKKRTNLNAANATASESRAAVISSPSPTSWSSGPRRRPTASCSRPGSGVTRKPGAASARRNDVVDPLAVGITDNNPQTSYRATRS